MRMLGSQYSLPIRLKRNTRTRSLGKLVPVNDQTAFAEATTATLEDDTNQDALRQRATQFSPENMIEKFEFLIRDEISGIGQ